MAVEGVTPRQLQERLAAGEDLIVLDVRERGEVALGSIQGSLHIPMGEILGRVAELDPLRATVCVCHHGIRSAQVAGALERLVDEAIAANPKSVTDYRGGKKEAAKFLVGQVMRLSKGKANPQEAARILSSRLDRPA